MTSQWEVASRLQLEVERQKRMENDYRRDLAQKNAQIDELKSELKNKTGKSIFAVCFLEIYWIKRPIPRIFFNERVKRQTLYFITDWE